MKWYINAIKHYDDFDGRASREEYWMFILFNGMFTVTVILLDNILGLHTILKSPIKEIIYGPFWLLYAIFSFLPNLAVTVRRMHDAGKSGAMILVILIPCIGPIWFFILMATGSKQGKNKYDLKNIQSEEEYFCSNCKIEMELTPEEIAGKKYICPECGTSNEIDDPLENKHEKEINLIIKKHSKTEQGLEQYYINKCLSKEYSEAEEIREWNSIEGYSKIIDPLNSSNNQLAAIEAEKLCKVYIDFHHIYQWRGLALKRMKDYTKAKEVLQEGLKKSKSLFDLCNLLGDIERDLGNISEAVYWWSQGMHLQESLSQRNYGGSEDSYLFLYYVAKGLGLSDSADAFILRVDSIKPGQIRLNENEANRLILLSRNEKDKAMGNSIEVVINKLVETYILPKARPERKLIQLRLIN